MALSFFPFLPPLPCLKHRREDGDTEKEREGRGWQAVGRERLDGRNIPSRLLHETGSVGSQCPGVLGDPKRTVHSTGSTHGS